MTSAETIFRLSVLAMDTDKSIPSVKELNFFSAADPGSAQFSTPSPSVSPQNDVI